MFSVKRCVSNPSHYLFVGPQFDMYQFDLVTLTIKEKENIAFDLCNQELLQEGNICLWSFKHKDDFTYKCSRIVYSGKAIDTVDESVIRYLTKNGNKYRWGKLQELPEELKTFMCLFGIQLEPN